MRHGRVRLGRAWRGGARHGVARIFNLHFKEVLDEKIKKGFQGEAWGKI